MAQNNNEWRSLGNNIFWNGTSGYRVPSAEGGFEDLNSLHGTVLRNHTILLTPSNYWLIRGPSLRMTNPPILIPTSNFPQHLRHAFENYRNNVPNLEQENASIVAGVQAFIRKIERLEDAKSRAPLPILFCTLLVASIATPSAAVGIHASKLSDSAQKESITAVLIGIALLGLLAYNLYTWKKDRQISALKNDAGTFIERQMQNPNPGQNNDIQQPLLLRG